MPSRDERQYSILYVEDNEAQRYAIARVLRQAGYEVMEAMTGEDALRLVLQHPDLVLLDVKLPDMTGFEVCTRIRANPSTAAIPVVHLSATFITSGSKVHGLESGADAYLTQPIEPPELLATIKAMIRGRERWLASEHVRPAVVLSIHSSAEVLHSRRLVLESAGYVVLTASNPEQAKELLETQTVDAVLLDVEIAGQDAATTTKMLRKVRPNTPIVQLGTSDIPTDGADVALVKAQGTEAVLQVLRRVLKRPGAAAGS